MHFQEPNGSIGLLNRDEEHPIVRQRFDLHEPHLLSALDWLEVPHAAQLANRYTLLQVSQEALELRKDPATLGNTKVVERAPEPRNILGVPWCCSLSSGTLCPERDRALQTRARLLGAQRCTSPTYYSIHAII